MDRERPGLEPVTFCVPMGYMVQSLTPSGLEIAQCRLQSRFVVDNCRARAECRTDVSGRLRTILGPYSSHFFQEKRLFPEKTTSKSSITRGGCNVKGGQIIIIWFSRVAFLIHILGQHLSRQGAVGSAWRSVPWSRSDVLGWKNAAHAEIVIFESRRQSVASEGLDQPWPSN